MAYSPLEQGLLTGAFSIDYHLEAGSSRSNIPWFKPENRRGVLDLLASWSYLLEKYHCSMSQLVIAWTIAQPGITFALCGARKAVHAINNAQAGTLNLTNEDSLKMRTDVEKLTIK